MLVGEGSGGAFWREVSIGDSLAQPKKWNAWTRVSDTSMCLVNKSQWLESFTG